MVGRLAMWPKRRFLPRKNGKLRAGRNRLQQVVLSAGGDGDGSLGELLAAHVGEVDVIGPEFGELVLQLRRRGRQAELAGEEADGLGERVDGDHLDVLDHRGLRRRGGGHDEPFEPRLLRRRDGDRQGAASRTRRAVEGQFADHGVFVKTLVQDLPAGRQHAEANRQVERRGLLGQLGRGQIDHHPILRPHEAGIDQHRLTRWVLSLTAASGRPTSTVLGSARRSTSTSTSTGKASMPTSEKVDSLASIEIGLAGRSDRSASQHAADRLHANLSLADAPRNVRLEIASLGDSRQRSFACAGQNFFRRFHHVLGRDAEILV